VGLLVVGSPGLAQGGKPAPDPQVLAKAIDAEIRKALDSRKVPVSPPADDAEFLRRVSLDIAGVIPAAEKAAAFLDNRGPDRRARLIDELLAGPEHARQMSDLWLDLLMPRTAEATRRDQMPIVRWLNRSFAENKPLDRLFAELLTANGFQDENPATTFFVVHESVDQLVDTVSRALLGVHLQCAQCHNHPFSDWKREEYWAFAGFFSKVGRLYDRSPQAVERYGARENVKQPLMLPFSAKKLPPRFLRGEQPKLDPDKPYLPVLANWLIAPDNPYFARAMVNRIWFQFFGRGLVNPVDRMNADNPPTHPALLDLLTRQFAAAGFDARFLMRAICLSETYQRSSRPPTGNKGDQQLYSHMPVRVLLPFQLCDSLERVWSIGSAKQAIASNDPKAEQWMHGHRTSIAGFFAPEAGSLPTEYKLGIPQALRLMNGNDSTLVYRVLVKVLEESKTSQDVIRRLYLIALSRRPTPEELNGMDRFVKKHGNNPETYQDILWVLVNSTEFVTNH
jgi:hypothetical protein